MSVKIEMSGITGFKFKIRNGMTEALVKGAEDVIKLASELAPVGDGRGGHLNQSGKLTIQTKNIVLVNFGTTLPDERAPAQEFGTIYMEAQPYLIPAMQQVDLTLYLKQALGLGGKGQ